VIPRSSRLASGVVAPRASPLDVALTLVAKDVNAWSAARRAPEPYDGPSSTITQLQSGTYDTTQPLTGRALAMATTMPVCGYFVRFRNIGGKILTPNGGKMAFAQGVAPGGGSPRDVYYNSDPNFWPKYFTEGTVVHEALHNLTGKSDTQLQVLFNIPVTDKTVNITERLLKATCAK
jgi:hypothetical protein